MFCIFTNYSRPILVTVDRITKSLSLSVLQQEFWRILGNLLYELRGTLFPKDCDALKTLYSKITLKEKENGRQILLKWEGSKNTYVGIEMEDNSN